MAARIMETSGCTTPPPTPEELSTIVELQTEHVQLLEARKCQLGLFNYLYSEFEWASMIYEQIHRENASLCRAPVSWRHTGLATINRAIVRA